MAATSSNVENLPPQVIRCVSRELVDLSERPPDGIKVLLNEADVTDVQAAIEGPVGTPFEGGLFRVKLTLGREFPAAPPQGFFLTKIFHPNVAQNGAICVNTLKRDWKPEHGIKHILLTIKCLLICPNPESALNEEAGKMLLERYADYSARARMMTEIHAQPAGVVAGSPRAGGSGPGNASSRPGLDRPASSGADKRRRDKKKALKRL